MAPHTITPVKTQRGGDTPTPVPETPSLDERVEMLADAVELALDPQANAADKASVLATMRRRLLRTTRVTQKKG